MRNRSLKKKRLLIIFFSNKCTSIADYCSFSSVTHFPFLTRIIFLNNSVSLHNLHWNIINITIQKKNINHISFFSTMIIKTIISSRLFYWCVSSSFPFTFCSNFLIAQFAYRLVIFNNGVLAPHSSHLYFLFTWRGCYCYPLDTWLCVGDETSSWKTSIIDVTLYVDKSLVRRWGRACSRESGYHV